MFTNIVISGMGVYHPNNLVKNDYFIEHFDNLGIDIRSLLESQGRNERFLSVDVDETIITMGTSACKDALTTAGIDPLEINSIIYATDTPEYITPCNAMMVNAALGAKNAHCCFDFNTSCTGMLHAMDIAKKMMLGDDRLNVVVVVGSLMASMVACEIDPVVYSNMADSAAAVVLTKETSSKKRGLIDASAVVDTFVVEGYKSPQVGFSKIFNDDVEIHDKKLRFNEFDGSFVPKVWSQLIEDVLQNNDLNKTNLNHFCFSQFSQGLGLETLDILGLPHSMQTYVGDRYGYTGCTSPLIAFYHALHEHKVDEGDRVIFCTVGAGFNAIALLYQL